MTWDIFCNVIDNYGDIGVAWRLARQLATEYALPVRLWVDDLPVFARIWPEIDPARDAQVCRGVEVRRWGAPFPDVAPAGVVIEAFGCELPAAYLAAMARQTPSPVWINLEYLSAEPWVRSHHGLPSPHPRLPLTKYFFFPGYEPGTGGVLAERDLIARRAAFLRDGVEPFWASVGVPARVPGELRVSLFAYENPALPALLTAWAQGARPVTCLVPESRVLAQVAAWLAAPDLHAPAVYRRGRLTLRLLPFMDQDAYDRLLWACDVNFVRGEDSCVRAQWAARPLVWHVYPQADDAHHAKLEALLGLYSRGLSDAAAQALAGMWRTWNGASATPDGARAWYRLDTFLPELERHAEAWCGRLTQAGNLAANLVAFVKTHAGLARDDGLLLK
jgi:uncharacterized repeat protein (TIGR03837 family)